MTTDTLAAPTQTRPPHIDPRWWYRATWRARQTAIDTHNRQTRAAHVEEPDTARVPEPKPKPSRRRVDTDTLIRTVEEMLGWTNDIDMILAELGMSVSATEVRLRRAGLYDLSAIFARHRDNERSHNPCPHCGKRMYHTSMACKPCSLKLQSRGSAA